MARTNARPLAASSVAWAEAACLLAGALTPLAFHTFGTVGFEATKAAIVRVLALILALGWLAGWTARLRAGRTSPAASGLLPAAAARPLLFAVGGLVLSLALSTVLSIQPLVSLWGSWDRVQGLVTVLAWLVLGIAAAVVGRDDEARRGLATAWLAASLPICLYALVQRARLDVVSWLDQPLGATSTLGSATALGTYLAMLLPLTLARAVDAYRALGAHLAAEDGPAPGGRPGRRARRRREAAEPSTARLAVEVTFCAFLVILQVAALVAAGVRGGLLGATVGLAVTGAAIVGRVSPQRRRLAVGAGVMVALIVAVTLAAGPLRDGALETDSTGQRLLIWRAAVETVAAGGWRALLGFGLETQAVALEPRFPAELAARYEDLRFDRAHNGLLDTLLTTGLLGVLATAALLVLVTRAGARALVGGAERAAMLTAGLLGALAAHLAANSVAFDSNATGVLGAMVAGLLVSPTLPTPTAPATAARAPAATAEGRRRGDARIGLAPLLRLKVTGWLTAIAVGAALVPWLLAPLMADLYHTSALALRAAEAPASSITPELEAAGWVPWQDVPLLAAALAYEDVARTTANPTGPVTTTFEDLRTRAATSREAQLEAARLALERAVEVNPRDPYTHAYLARLWATRAKATDDPAARADALARSVSAYDRAIELGPRRVRFYDEAGQALVARGRPDFAIARYRQAEALARPTAERTARIGDAERARGDSAAARDLYERALQLDARSAPAEAGLALLDREAGNLAGSLEHAQRAARFQMRTWQYHRDLALASRDVGQREEGLAAARTARRLAPAWEWNELTELVESLR